MLVDCEKMKYAALSKDVRRRYRKLMSRVNTEKFSYQNYFKDYVNGDFNTREELSRRICILNDEEKLYGSHFEEGEEA